MKTLRLALAVSLCTPIPLAAHASLAAAAATAHPETSPTGYPTNVATTPAAAPAEYPVSPPQLAAVVAAQLPPEILVDRHLVRVDRLLADDDYGAALTVMDEIIALQRQHDLVLPEKFHFQYAEVAFGAGLTEAAIASLNDYLVAAGRSGDFYRQALELLDTAEEALRRAEAERQRVEAQRQRAAARQRAHDELVQRQLGAADRPWRDTLRSGGRGPEMVPMARGRFQYFTYQGRTDLEWVDFDRPFAIAKYEVTRGEFELFVDRTRYRTEARRDPEYGCRSFPDNNTRRNSSLRWNRPGFDQTDRHPVTCVSVRDAMAYARWLSQETEHSYRLPSAAEWQYAARAGSEEAQLYIESTDPNSRNSCGRANLYESDAGTNSPACRDGVGYTTDVARFPPNPVGVHDMIGNVSELVLACGHVQPDDFIRLTADGGPEQPDSCGRYVAAMGAAWYHNGTPARFSRYSTWHQVYAQPSRDRVSGDWRYRRNSTTWTGFRVVRDLP